MSNLENEICNYNHNSNKTIILHTKLTSRWNYHLRLKRPILTVYDLIHIGLRRVLTADRILIYLRSRPNREQPPGLGLGTQVRESKYQTARPYRRPPVYSN